ncbi:DUF3710 domain-containing protein [Pseudonocardia sp. DSM 110487]|uniref:DUF3710 domain-containing protein n=1 Tax=Pseudonocardia sp. DSM 110487 TaxID=2865833 RepID=UPI001C6A3D55|nr:DUF3710 domain-containing protein [Pseudonocardia sp. DSM 110487]QYN38523.1 DUF3710 domain-containing protein [Pseudonocardia sp. DSM 110487]
MARRDRGTREVRFDKDADGGGLALDTETALPPTGPHDSDGLDPEVTDAAGLVDFGSIRVPVPPDGAVTVEPTTGDRMQAVHIRLPEGRLSVSALAAPKTSKLWPELSREIDGSLREGGARVRSFPGEWGRELHATSGGATSVFVGVDGPRWMLYGVATGPSAHAAHLDAELRRMLRGTVVARGKKPFPVRTILPLAMPDHLAAEAAETPAVPAAGAKKRSSPKAATGKSAPGKTAPGKTAPPNSDAASAAAKKAAARRAAARKAAAAAAVKAAAEALAEQAAEDRAAAGEHPDTRSAVRKPVAGTIPTGPGPDAPLREQAPSARRAAAAAWRAAEENAAPPPTEALPVARPVEESPVTEAFPLGGADVPPTEALPVVGPGAGGRRRPAEAGPVAPPPSRGRRHLPERPVEQSYPGGRRRLREPVAEMPPPPYPREQESGRRRLQQPDGALGSTAPWDLSEPGGRRRLREPDPDSAGPASGRRQQREPGPDRVNGVPLRRAEPFDADQGVSASGRRHLREPWDGAEPVADIGVSASGRQPLREPSGPVADSGVSASGRRHLREPWDEAERGGGPQPWETTPGRPNGSDGLRRPAGDHWDADPADSGVSASGRRRLREWDDAAPMPDTGVSASGRQRPREPWERGPGDADRSGGRRRLDELPALRDDAGVSGTGRRRLRESWDGAAPDTGPREPAPRPPDGSGEYHQAGVDARFRPVDDVSASGRRRIREPLDDVAPVSDAGMSATGRRHLREPWEEAGPEPGAPGGSGGSGGRRRLGEPTPVDHGGGRRRREADAGDDLISGTGGRRRLHEPASAPIRDGSQTEPWLVAPDGPLDGSARRTLGAQYLIDTGEQDADWATDLGDYEERRDGGRHSGADDASDTTVRLQALLNELDPNRPRRRHRR